MPQNLPLWLINKPELLSRCVELDLDAERFISSAKFLSISDAMQERLLEVSDPRDLFTIIQHADDIKRALDISE